MRAGFHSRGEPPPGGGAQEQPDEHLGGARDPFVREPRLIPGSPRVVDGRGHGGHRKDRKGLICFWPASRQESSSTPPSRPIRYSWTRICSRIGQRPLFSRNQARSALENA